MYPDQKESKVRPVLIISNSIFHQNSGFFVCVGITTNKTPNAYLLPFPRNQIEDGQLDFDSQIMCHRIVTLNSNFIKKKIAKVTKEFYGEITNKIDKDILEL